MFPVILSTLANADIHDIVSYLDEQSFDAGDCFYDQVNRTLERLEQMPELGTVCHFGNTGAEIRVWPVRGFPNHLVFYRITPPCRDDQSSACCTVRPITKPFFKDKLSLCHRILRCQKNNHYRNTIV